MKSAKLIAALVVVVAGTYLWYQRGLLTRDHELCLNATQALFEQLPIGARIEEEEDYKDYIDAYTSWYSYCRGNRFKRRNAGLMKSLEEAEQRQDDN